MKQSEIGTVRISNQYRDRNKGMVYELRAGDAKLVLCALQNPESSTQWQFSAYPMQSPQLVIVGGWGASRTEAFRAMRDLWVSKGPALGLAAFDWDQVAQALTQVRALG